MFNEGEEEGDEMKGLALWFRAETYGDLDSRMTWILLAKHSVINFSITAGSDVELDGDDAI